MFIMHNIEAKSFVVRIDSVNFESGTDTVEQRLYTIQNTDDQPLWIWFDDNDMKDDSILIRRHFLKRKGEVNLLFWSTDPNILQYVWESTMPSLQLFVKYLKRDDSFTIVFYNDKRKAHRLSNTKIEQIVKVFYDNEIRKYVDNNLNVKMIDYPYNVIVLPESIIIEGTKGHL